jgi:hypothetical protein
MYIMALLGMELFANYGRFDQEGELVTDVLVATKEGRFVVPPRENFDNVGPALTTVFILILGEDWPGIMYNYIRVYDGSLWVALYFVFVFCLGNLMMLSLFTAILLANFEGGDDDEEEEETPDLELEDKPDADEIEEMFSES